MVRLCLYRNAILVSLCGPHAVKESNELLNVRVSSVDCHHFKLDQKSAFSSSTSIRHVSSLIHLSISSTPPTVQDGRPDSRIHTLHNIPLHLSQRDIIQPIYTSRTVPSDISTTLPNPPICKSSPPLFFTQTFLSPRLYQLPVRLDYQLTIQRPMTSLTVDSVIPLCRDLPEDVRNTFASFLVDLTKYIKGERGDEEHVAVGDFKRLKDVHL